MTNEEKYRLIYEYQRGGYENFPTFEEWLNKIESDFASKEDFEFEYSYAVIAKERTKKFQKLIQENSYVLINNGIDEEEIDYILSNEIYSINMDSEIIRMLFVIETLKVFNIYDHNIKINNIETIGGGYYDDGEIYGYNINIDNGDKYRIELLDFEDAPEEGVTSLSFKPSNNKDYMDAQIEMLKKFEGSYNDGSIIMARKKLEEARDKKIHI